MISPAMTGLTPLWIIDDKATIERIIEYSKTIFQVCMWLMVITEQPLQPCWKRRKKKQSNHTGKEEYNYFMSVIFPDNQLKIIDYNRVIKDLNGLTEEEFLKKLEEIFEVEKVGIDIYKPEKLHEFSMYMSGEWYKLSAKSHTYDDNDPIGVLDVTVLSVNVLDKILDIKDLRTSNRVDFVGGIRGLGELKRRVDSGEMKAAFALYPVSMQQLINISDTGNIMPPKTTWFEPKLRSGLVIHELA